MLGAMLLGGFLNSVLGSGGAETSSGKNKETNVQIIQKKNEFIEYQEWLEKRRQGEMQWDETNIDVIYKDKISHCPKCGAKIRYDVRSVYQTDSLENYYRLTLSCNCNQVFKLINKENEIGQMLVSSFNQKLLSIKEDKLYFLMINACPELREKITGVVSRDEIRKWYLDAKLARKIEEEKYYGKTMQSIFN